MVKTAKDIVSRLSLSLALTALAAMSMPMTAGAIPPAMREQLVETFQEADLDEDGQLTRFEVKAGGLPDPIFRNFRRIDTNKSGTITLKETVIALNRGVIVLKASSIEPRVSLIPAPIGLGSPLRPASIEPRLSSSPAVRNIANRQVQLYGSQSQNYQR